MQTFQGASAAEEGKQRQELEEKEQGFSEESSAKPGKQTQELDGKERERPKESEAEVWDLTQAEYDAKARRQWPQGSRVEARTPSQEMGEEEGKVLSRNTARRCSKIYLKGRALLKNCMHT